VPTESKLINLNVDKQQVCFSVPSGIWLFRCSSKRHLFNSF